MTDRIEKQHQRALIEYFSSGEIVEKAEKYLGFKPKIKQFVVYANLPGLAKEKEIGSKAFHRDALCHRVYEVFFAITSVNNENGPFYFVVNSELQIVRKFDSKKYEKNDWASSGRLSETELDSCIDGKLNIGKFFGEAGSYVSLNTGVTYHRGGHVTKGYRIVGRIIFGGEEYKNTEQLGPMKKAIFENSKENDITLGDTLGNYKMWESFKEGKKISIVKSDILHKLLKVVKFYFTGSGIEGDEQKPSFIQYLAGCTLNFKLICRYLMFKYPQQGVAHTTTLDLNHSNLKDVYEYTVAQSHAQNASGSFRRMEVYYKLVALPPGRPKSDKILIIGCRNVIELF